MKIPKMILFDYGQTLIAEQKFDGVKGTEACHTSDVYFGRTDYKDFEVI